MGPSLRRAGDGAERLGRRGEADSELAAIAAAVAAAAKGPPTHADAIAADWLQLYGFFD